MKYLMLILVGSILLSAFADAPNCNDLFIAGYYDGLDDPENSIINKALILYNPTVDSIDLSDYAVYIYENGSNSFPSAVTLSGFLQSYSYYVIANDKIDTSDSLLNIHVDLFTSDLYFNGNDAVSLEDVSQSLDIIGVIGTDPGSSGWTVDSGSTAGYSLTRIDTVQAGQTNWTVGKNEWAVHGLDDLDFAIPRNAVSEEQILLAFSDTNYYLN